MKNKDLQELKTKSLKEVRGSISTLEKEMVNATLELKMGKIKNVHQVAQIKRSIAQGQTIARMKEILEKENQEKIKGVKDAAN